MADKSVEIRPGIARRVREPAAASGWSYRPRIDVTETPDEFMILADMPGTRADDIQISFENRTLTIHAPVPARQDGEMEYLTHEYGIGDFDRELIVADVVDAAGISAEYEHGVLKVHLPKSEEARPRRIQVRSG